MNIKLAQNEDLTINTKTGAVVAVPSPAVGLGNASVTFPDGFWISVRSKTYTAPSGGETIEFFGPIYSSGYNYWVPSEYKDLESFDPTSVEVWYLIGMRTPTSLGFAGYDAYSIDYWNTSSPTLDIVGSVEHGGHPSMSRGEDTDTKVLATTSDLVGKASDLDVVHKTGSEVISGTKSFSYSGSGSYVIGEKNYDTEGAVKLKGVGGGGVRMYYVGYIRLDRPSSEGGKRAYVSASNTQNDRLTDGSGHPYIKSNDAYTGTPEMDNGNGSAGSATEYARGDHVHPSDTSRVAVSGDTMTGPLNFGDAYIDPSDGTICYNGELRGTLIKLGEMSLWDPKSGSGSAKRWTMEVTRAGTAGFEDIATLDDINSKIGDIDSVLDAINGEVI